MHPVRPRTELNARVQSLRDDVEAKVLCPTEEVAGEGEPEAERQAAEDPERRDPAEEEARVMRAPPIPATPTLEEVRQHRLTHCPYRSWCPHCVRGKGREDRHAQSGQKGVWEGIPKVVSDYFFIGRIRPSKRGARTGGRGRSQGRPDADHCDQGYPK